MTQTGKVPTKPSISSSPPAVTSGDDAIGMVSSATLAFMSPLMSLGSQRPLTMVDITALPREHSTINVRDQLAAHRYHDEPQRSHGASASSLALQLNNAFGTRWEIAGACHVASAACQLIIPYVLQSLLRYLRRPLSAIHHHGGDTISELIIGMAYATMLALLGLLSSIAINHNWYQVARSGTSIRSSLMACIMQKSLRLSIAQSSASAGDITTLVTTDVDRVMERHTFIHYLWAAPATIGIALVAMWIEIGWPAIAGGILMLAMTPIQTRLSKRIGAARRAVLTYTDQRIRAVSELLAGIKIIKLNGWQHASLSMISSLRDRELAANRCGAAWQATSDTLAFVSGALVGCISMGLYSFVTGQTLTVEKTFAFLAFLNAMRFPTSILPRSLTVASEGLISLQRIATFLMLPEVDKITMTPFEDNTERDIAVKLVAASYHWPQVVTPVIAKPVATITAAVRSSLALRDISLTIRRGSLTAIVGSVGHGKSALIMALLGELSQPSGKRWGHASSLPHHIYVSQEPLVINGTLEANIVFGRTSTKYTTEQMNRAIDDAALAHDVAGWNKGTSTEIGDRGVTLSSGQKTRIALARAFIGVTNDDDKAGDDLFLFDDPFASLDGPTSHHIWQQGICGTLRRQTRVIVMPNQSSLLSSCDQIIYMRTPSTATESHIAAIGTFAELSKSNESFRDWLSSSSGSSSMTSEEKKTTASEVIKPTPVAVKLAAAPATPASVPLVVPELRQVGAIKQSIYRSYFGAALSGHGRLMITMIMIAYLIAQLLRVTADMWLSSWSQPVSVRVSTWLGDRSDIAWLIGYALCIISAAIVAYARAIGLARVALRASKQLHDTTLQHLVAAPTATFHDITPSGQLLNRFSRDMEQIDVQLPLAMATALQNMLQVIGSVILICYATPWFTISLLPIAWCIWSVHIRYQSAARELRRLLAISRSPVLSSVTMMIRGAPVIRAFGTGDHWCNHVTPSLIDKNAAINFAVAVSNRWFGLRLDGYTTCITWLVAVCCVITRIYATGMGLPVMAPLALVYSLQFTSFLQFTIRIAGEAQNHFTAVERLHELADVAPEEATNVPATFKWPIEEKGSSIVFRGVTASYRPGLPTILNDVSCDIASGAKIGICGRTGCGKSSLLSSLVRLLPLSSGSILVDNTDITHIPLQSLRDRITVIPQEATLFTGTLRWNLDANHRYTDDAIWHALTKSHLSSLVKSLPLQLNHPIIAPYGDFSIGQRQLLCLARAILRQSSVVVLDEATASLDSDTATLIHATVASEFVDRTVITIAHRVDLLMSCDRVMVMNDARIVEYDTPQRLAASPSSVFASLRAAESS